MVKQILIVFGICLAGTVLSGLLPIPLPGSVLAMLGLLALLGFGAVKEHSVSGFCDLMQSNMAFFFIPAGIAAIENLDILRQSALELLVVCVLGTFVTFAVTGFTVKAILKHQKKGRNDQ